jgi:ArsR family transcriptional regulator
MSRRHARTYPEACCAAPRLPVPSLDGGIDPVLAIFKALADPTRLGIFRLIATQDGPVCACDVVDQFTVSQPTIAHHMKVLETAGLISVTREGVWAYYAVRPHGVAIITTALAQTAQPINMAV